MITLFGCAHFFNFVSFLLYPKEVKSLVCNARGLHRNCCFYKALISVSHKYLWYYLHFFFQVVLHTLCFDIYMFFSLIVYSGCNTAVSLDMLVGICSSNHFNSSLHVAEICILASASVLTFEDFVC